MALGAQAVTVAAGLGAGASEAAVKTVAHAVGGLTAALGKEAIGEQMKTYPSLGATIKLPTDSTWQKEGPRIMAGVNDMWTAMAGAFTGAALGTVLEPAVKNFAQAHGASEPLATGLAMGANYAAQRLVISPAFDTISDLTSTYMKSKLPGAQGGEAHNAKFDTATMAGGMIARGIINWGGTMVLGPAVNAGKLLTGGNFAEKTAVTNAIAWAGLPGWISLKAHTAEAIKNRSGAQAAQTLPTTQPATQPSTQPSTQPAARTAPAGNDGGIPLQNRTRQPQGDNAV